MKIDGGCHCGEIAFEADLDPAFVGICHCSDCQSLSASAFRTLAIVQGDTFRILRGTPIEYIKTGDSGNRRIQAFCGNCGSGLYSASADELPTIYNLRLGTVRQRGDLKPQFECWRHSALDWVGALPDTKVFPGNPSL